MIKKLFNISIMILLVTQVFVFTSCSEIVNYKKVENIDDCYIFNNHTYFYIKHKTNWYNAKNACESQEAHLLIINEKQENDFIKQIINNNTWLGLTDEKTESIWKWVNEQPLIFSDWMERQPDNYGDKEHYAYYNLFSEYYNWNDREDNDNLKFICEYDFEITDAEVLVKYKNDLIMNVDIFIINIDDLTHKPTFI